MTEGEKETEGNPWSIRRGGCARFVEEEVWRFPQGGEAESPTGGSRGEDKS